MSREVVQIQHSGRLSHQDKCNYINISACVAPILTNTLNFWCALNSIRSKSALLWFMYVPKNFPQNKGKIVIPDINKFQNCTIVLKLLCSAFFFRFLLVTLLWRVMCAHNRLWVHESQQSEPDFKNQRSQHSFFSWTGKFWLLNWNHLNTVL